MLSNKTDFVLTNAMLLNVQMKQKEVMPKCL